MCECDCACAFLLLFYCCCLQVGVLLVFISRTRSSLPPMRCQCLCGRANVWHVKNVCYLLCRKSVTVTTSASNTANASHFRKLSTAHASKCSPHFCAYTVLYTPLKIHSIRFIIRFSRTFAPSKLCLYDRTTQHTQHRYVWIR